MVFIFASPPAPPVAPEPGVLITRGSTVIEPLVLNGYESTRETRNIVHAILGRADPDITLRPAGVRTGTLRLIFDDEDVSRFAEVEHSYGGAFTLHSADRRTIEMTYVPVGRVTRELDDQTRRVWVVSVEFQEVLL